MEKSNNMKGGSRLTKSAIEVLLLSGKPVEWKEDTGLKKLCLETPAQRRIFAFLLKSKVRDPKGLPLDFVAGLQSAFSSGEDPALNQEAEISPYARQNSWLLNSVETEGVGGLNIWGGDSAKFTFNGQSCLVEGSNGSGKSSLTGAILWALTGERPRDQADEPGHEARPVYGPDEQTLGSWPPLACYPTGVKELGSPPYVRVLLTFINDNGDTVTAERILKDGAVTVRCDSQLNIPPIFFETGILMPTKLGTLRFDEGKGRLTEAVQRLTGLDDLIAIGSLVAGLSHGSREYLSHLRKEAELEGESFKRQINDIREVLISASEEVPEFQISETGDDQSRFALFGKNISTKAAELTSVVADDLVKGIDIKDVAVQSRIASAISSVKNDLDLGLNAIPTWNLASSIAEAFDEVALLLARSSIGLAHERLNEAFVLAKKSDGDSRFQLKALASLWHEKHSEGPIENCPLCRANIDINGELVKELSALKNSGEAAARTLKDNLNSILEELTSSVPNIIHRLDSGVVNIDVKSKIISDIRSKFIRNHACSTVLASFESLIEEALSKSPPVDLQFVALIRLNGDADKIYEKIEIIESCIVISNWFRHYSNEWIGWWKDTCGLTAAQDGTDPPLAASPISSVLNRVGEALSKSDPYRRAVELMRKSWLQGKKAAEIQGRLDVREAIAKNCASFKTVGSLAESLAGNTITGLSARIESMLANTLVTEKLKFGKTRLKRKEGLILHGSINEGLHVDATLVANTAWLRAVLWAFIFSLREEAVEQLGFDPMPLFVFDDPQATFDGLHRHRWSQHIAGLQNQSGAKAQVLIFSHDETFLELIQSSGVRGRQAMLLAASDELGAAKIYEGAALQRKWTDETKTAAPNWQSYVAKVREYIEGLLKMMLRGESILGSSPQHGLTIGTAREKIRQLNANKVAPWNRKEFLDLAECLVLQKPAVKFMEMSHHSGGRALTKDEATDVRSYWTEIIEPKLLNAFRIAREYYHLHGKLTALHEPVPTIAFPDGHSNVLRKLPLNVLGRAAALTNGRIADGHLEVEHFEEGDIEQCVFGKHSAFRLTASTLEPVAMNGDILLVKEDGNPPAKSLVVTLCDGRMLARRYDNAKNHDEVAVLTAQTIHPHRIADPIVAHKNTILMRKIVGVLYDHNGSAAGGLSDGEFCGCGGESILKELAKNALGLVKVEGDSAVPYALNGQYLLIGHPITDASLVAAFSGRPVIASDTNNQVYFKRLRLPIGNEVILESLEVGGNFEPIVLSKEGQGSKKLKTIWPVLGVIFER
jgi:hypothetical protein